MDIVADAGLVLGLGREAALGETLSWLQHSLVRHAAQEAARAKSTALATLHATATAFGAKDAHHGFNAYLARMDSIIALASGETPQAAMAAAAEESFEAISRRAR